MSPLEAMDVAYQRGLAQEAQKQNASPKMESRPSIRDAVGDWLLPLGFTAYVLGCTAGGVIYGLYQPWAGATLMGGLLGFVFAFCGLVIFEIVESGVTRIVSAFAWAARFTKKRKKGRRS